MNNYEKNYYDLNFIIFFEFFYIDIVILKKCIKIYQHEPVWECGCGCFSKCFLCQNTSKWYFLFFKKLFLRSAYQNDPKQKKN